MATSTARGSRLLLALENYSKNALHRGRWDAANIFRKVTLTSAGDGYLRGHFTVESGMCNSGDFLHGGFMASLMDTISVFGYTSHPLARPNVTCALQTHYMHPAKLGDRVEFCTTPLRISKGGGLVDSVLVDSQGRLLARATVLLQIPVSSAAASFKKSVETNLGFNFEDPN